MRNNITRWHPVTCECIVEQVTVYDDNNEKILKDPQFLLMNTVCEKHQPLASTQHRENHAELGAQVMNFIEEAKSRNMAQIDNRLPTLKLAHHRRQLEKNRVSVSNFNNEITQEWQELVSFAHAFDSHIYEQILKENML